MAPTPHHTKPMIDRLVADMLEVWNKLGMPLSQETCPKVQYTKLILIGKKVLGIYNVCFLFLLFS